MKSTDLVTWSRELRASIRNRGLIDGLLFYKHEEKEGLAGEPARALYCLKLTAIYSFPALILWGTLGLENKPWSILTAGAVVVALIVGIPGVFLSAYHAITVIITRLPNRTQGMTQVVLAVALWLIPAAFFFPSSVGLSIQNIGAAFALSTQSRGWEYWFFDIFYVNMVHGISRAVPPKFIPIRSYLILTLPVLLVATARAGDSSEANRIIAATLYLWYIALGYGAIFVAGLRGHTKANYSA